MALKSYRKSTNYSSRDYSTKKSKPVTNDEVTIKQPAQTPREPITMWNILSGFYQGLKGIVASSTSAGIVIPGLLILGGVGFIYLQVQPTIVNEVREAVGYFDQGTTSPVQGTYIESRQQYISNPSASYFEKLEKSAKSAGFNEDQASLNYDGTFYISIPRLNINRLPVAANVESDKEEVYDKVLDQALAHFKGTSLPITSNAGNIVIYGHSTGGSYTPRPNDVVSAFSLLQQLQVGDEIIIEIDGIKHKYRMTRSKIVKPNDTSILLGKPGRETLTLFTCWPPGNQTHRQVITATPV